MSLGAVIAKSDEGGGQLVAAMNKAVNFANRFGVLRALSPEQASQLAAC